MALFRFMVLAALGLLASSALVAAPVPKDAGANRPVPEVQVVGVYEGTYPPGVQRAAGFPPNGAVTVKVGEVKKPIILVLTSYEPVVWTIEAPKGAVVQVITSGYYKQTVEGLDAKVPVTSISYKAGDKDYFFAYRKQAGLNEGENEQTQTKRQYERLVEKIKGLAKQDIKQFQGDYTGSTFEIK